METTVFVGGTILIDPTRDSTSRSTHALAIEGPRIVAIGDEAASLAHQADARVIDLDGGTLAPAVGDGHAHPVLGGQEALGPNINDARTLEDLIAAVAAYKRENPERAWIVGGSYDITLAPGGAFDARWLDDVTGDTPTLLRAFDHHTVWVNSAALKAAGITAETQDPPLGRILRRPDGEPLGTLQEAAANDLISNVVPPFTLAERLDSIERATRTYAAQGTTWVQDAWVEPRDVDLYLEAAKQNRLHCRMNLALRVDPHRWREQVAEFVRVREEIRALGHERLSAETVKFFIDGVVENHTAAMIEPYSDRPHERGLPNWTPADLEEAAFAFDGEEFQLHLHAIGDAANRRALDALERVVAAREGRRNRHVIAHISVLHPDDIARFARAGIIANFEPYWAQYDEVMQALTIPHIGARREDWQYSIGSVLRTGATVSFGSDWPVSTADWRLALVTALLRRDPADATADSWLPDERLSAAEGFAAYTSGIAAQAGAADRGTLEPGMTADLVWLSENPLEIDPHRISSIEVRGTWLAGTRTFTDHSVTSHHRTDLGTTSREKL